MRTAGTSMRLVAPMLALAVGISACGGSDPAPTAPPLGTSSSTIVSTSAAPSSTATTPGVPYVYGEGVVPAPCADAINETNGCVYLGVIADLSGPLQHRGLAMTRAQEDFWRRVNEQGGIGGFDVVVSSRLFVDAGGDPSAAAAAARALVGEVLGMAQVAGIESTLEALRSVFDPAGVLVASADPWSGWAISEQDRGLVLEAGSSYCVDAMNGVQFMDGFLADETGSMPAAFSWAIVATGDLFGGDYAAGASLGAEALSWPSPTVIVLSPAPTGDQIESAAATLVDGSVDLIVFATGPDVVADVWSRVWASWVEADPSQIPFALGPVPAWRESFANDPGLMTSLADRFFQTSSWEAWGAETAGHQAMRFAAERDGEAPSSGYLAGWISQYPWKALIAAAAEAGDLTRSSLVDLAEGLVVDFDGMADPIAYVGGQADPSARSTVVTRVSTDGPGGLTPITDLFSSQFAQAFSAVQACSVERGDE